MAFNNHYSARDNYGDIPLQQYHAEPLEPQAQRKNVISYNESAFLVGEHDDADSLRKPASPERDSLRSLLASWWLELLACVFSVASLAAIVVVLRMYDGRAAADLHMPKYLTLNGLLAIIGTINRAFMIAVVASAVLQDMWLHYADESEKLSGDAKLNDMVMYHSASYGAAGSIMFLIKFRRRRLLAYLACLIMILSLAYNTFVQQLVGLAIIPSKTSVPVGNLPRAETGFNYTGRPSEANMYLSLDLTAAVHSGIFGGAVQPIQPFCPTGNCTWPLTSSLAVCGGCTDSTFEQQSCSDQGVCTYSFPSGSTVEFNGGPGTGYGTAFAVVSGAGHIYNTQTDYRYYLANFDLMGMPPNTLVLQSSASAWECALWACVQVYNANLTSSDYHEEVAYTYDRSSVSTADMNTQQQMNFTFEDIPGFVDPAKETDFEVTWLSMVAAQQWFPQVFNCTATTNQEGAYYSNAFCQGIWAGTLNMDGWIANLSTIMTNSIRTANIIERPEFNGTAYELSIVIRWYWLALPVILVLSSILLLLAVMTRTKFSAAHSWKGSPLTLLLFEVEQELGQIAHGKVNEHNGIEKAIGETRIRMKKGEGDVRKFLHVD